VNRRGDFPEDTSCIFKLRRNVPQIAYAAAFIEWLGEEASASMKPASATPFSAVALYELAERAGCRRVAFPASPARRTRSAVLTANPTVCKLSFTGSTEVGKLLMQQCAGTLKKLSLAPALCPRRLVKDITPEAMRDAFDWGLDKGREIVE
jgi:hypothetical protein